jgi:DNA-binding FadR family transcriptional regulator
LLEVRVIVEPKAARWAAERGSDKYLDLIRSAIERMEEGKGSVEDFVVADAIFHRSILRAAKNEFLGAFEGVIFSALLSSIRLTNKDPRKNEESLQFHREVCEAIAAHDPEGAERAMQRLLGDTERRLGGGLSNRREMDAGR